MNGPRVDHARGRRTRALAVAAAAVVAMALLGAVATRNAQDPAVGPAAAVAVEVSGSGADVGAAAPAVTAGALDGGQVRIPAGRPSVVFFFAGWCGSCIPEATALGQLQRKHGDAVNIVAVSIDPGDTPQTIGEFMSAAGSPEYPVVHDETGAMRAAYEVASLDVTVITDGSGKVVYRDSVPSTFAQLSDGLRRAGVQV
ncbi:MAG: TlpA family protein disulfide reductase [Actinomycetota bacterium]|nr:TlpA family protein disulfide reductase [Actinomycetota bacterium]